MQAIILIALCLLLPALSKGLACKNIAGVPGFDFENFIKNKYSYVLGPDTVDFKSYKSASATSNKQGNTWYSTFAVTKKDGTTSSNKYIIQKVEGATIYEELLNAGKLTGQKYKNTVYAYKPGQYAQFYVCSQSDYKVDLRFAIVYGTDKLDPKLKKEMLDNDAGFGFTGALIEIGKN